MFCSTLPEIPFLPFALAGMGQGWMLGNLSFCSTAHAAVSSLGGGGSSLCFDVRSLMYFLSVEGRRRGGGGGEGQAL